MTVEIKELVIRAVTSTTPDPNENNQTHVGDSAPVRDELIQACVKEVLRILKQNEER